MFRKQNVWSLVGLPARNPACSSLRIVSTAVFILPYITLHNIFPGTDSNTHPVVAIRFWQLHKYSLFPLLRHFLFTPYPSVLLFYLPVLRSLLPFFVRLGRDFYQLAIFSFDQWPFSALTNGNFQLLPMILTFSKGHFLTFFKYSDASDGPFSNEWDNGTCPLPPRSMFLSLVETICLLLDCHLIISDYYWLCIGHLSIGTSLKPLPISSIFIEQSSYLHLEWSTKTNADSRKKVYDRHWQWNLAKMEILV